VIRDHPAPVLAALAVALLLWSPGSALARRRLRALPPPGTHAQRSGTRSVASRTGATRTVATTTVPTTTGAGARKRRLLAGAAGLAAGLLVGGTSGVAAAIGVAVVAERLLRRAEPDEDRAVRAAVTRDLPGACDLLGVCLIAGLPVGGALAAVGAALPPPLGPQLGGVAALYRLGAEPRRAWADVPAELAPLARAVVRAGDSGASVVPALRALASDTRSAARTLVEADVRRAGVWVLAPLGLCFLPAFICLGVVPLVLGIADGVLG
jgi:Flp pilus assembly protein TadB